MKKQGFTLIELLAVIMILGIILAIAVPNIVGLIEKTTREAFLLDAKMVIKVIENKLLENKDFDLSFLNANNIEEKLNISRANYQEIIFDEDNEGNIYVKIIGKNKWANLTACGIYNKMKVGKSNDIECEEIETSFVCGTPVLHGDYEYKTVLIGDQCWFKENLRYTNNGCLNNSWSNNANACMIHTKEDCQDLGSNYFCNWVEPEEVLYQWKAVMNEDEEGGQGLCPKGWHVPTDNEWRILEAFVDSEFNNPNEDEWSIKDHYRGFDAGKNLKSSLSWNGLDVSGFNALPIGYRTISGDLHISGISAYWWTSTANKDVAFKRDVHSNFDSIYRSLNSPGLGCSVRCLKN
ncbi:MAG: FISUMP domain-containing protein [Bacilli bacterium]